MRRLIHIHLAVLLTVAWVVMTRAEEQMDDSIVRQEGGLVAVPTTGDATTNAAETVTFPLFVTYRQACIEGWAAKPTNDVQRTVWSAVAEERRLGPRHPLRILPGQKPKRKSK